MINDIIESLKKYGENELGMLSNQSNNVIFIFLLACICLAFLSLIYKLFRELYLWKKQDRLYRDLVPYFSEVEIKHAIKYFIPTKYQNFSPAADEEPGGRFITPVKDKLIPFFLKKAFLNQAAKNKFFIILADSGMGKTTFLINLYLAYQNQFKQPSKIRLFPLSNPHCLESIDNIRNEDKKDTILLLDALNEDHEAIKDYKKRMEEVLNKVWLFRKVIITCRTQFLPSQQSESYGMNYIKFGSESGEYNFWKLYLSVFDDQDIKHYLRKKYSLINPLNWSKYRRAYKITHSCPNIMMRPMLLSNMDLLLAEGQHFEYSYQIYEIFIKNWINRVAGKNKMLVRYLTSENCIQLLEIFYQQLAINLYQNRKKRNGFIIHYDEKLTLPGKLQIADVEDIHQTQNQHEFINRSLSFRDADGYYKFTHNSILEYFLAKQAIEDISFLSNFDFTGLDQMGLFYSEMAFSRVIKSRLYENSGTYTTAGSETKKSLGELTFSDFRAMTTLHIRRLPVTVLKRFDGCSTLNDITIDLDESIIFSAFSQLQDQLYSGIGVHESTTDFMRVHSIINPIKIETACPTDSSFIERNLNQWTKNSTEKAIKNTVQHATPKVNTGTGSPQASQLPPPHFALTAPQFLISDLNSKKPRIDIANITRDYVKTLSEIQKILLCSVKFNTRKR